MKVPEKPEMEDIYMISKVILTVGLPRSGKSTWARETGHPIVCRDSIRLALHGEYYTQEAEEAVSMIEWYMARALMISGHRIVVIDACNLSYEYRHRWNQAHWKTELRVFDAPRAQCIDRAIKNEREDLIPIIERMDDRADWPDEEEFKRYEI